MKWATKDLYSEFECTLLELNADIWHRSSSKRIGYFQGFILQPTTDDLSSQELWNVCDAESSALEEYGGAILNSGLDVRVLCAGGEIIFAELVELLPRWQGRGIGISAFRCLLEEMSRRYFVSVCVFKPEPLQYTTPFSEAGADPNVAANYKAAKRRLSAYYQRNLNARKLRRSSNFYCCQVGAATPN